MLYYLFLILLPHLIQASAADSPEQLIFFGCKLAASKYQFGCDIDDFWSCSCDYDPLTTSILNCFDDFINLYKDPELFNKSMQTFGELCSVNKKGDYSFETLYERYLNSTNYIIEPQKDLLNNPIFYSPIKIDQKISTIYYTDMKNFYLNVSKSAFDGKVICLYWTLIFLGYAIYNHLYIKLISLLVKYKKFNNCYNKLKKHLLFPTFMETHHHNPLIIKKFSFEKFKLFTSALVPTKLESVILLIYSILNIYLLLFGYKLDSASYLFPSLKAQIVRYFADRSGIIAVDNIPVLVLLAGRNSILTWFTGIPYSSLIVYHKWISRGMFLNAFLHSFFYILIAVSHHNLKSNLHEEYYIFGVIATICAGMLIVQAMHFLRSNWYETFLLIHIVSAYIFLIGMIKHCIHVGWLEYTIASWAIWGFDRINRLLRVFKFGIKKAQIRLFNDETIQLTIPKGDNFKPFPGCYVFIYFWLPSTFWQSHPFCLIQSVLNDDEVVLYIQVKKGITKRLRDYVLRGNNHIKVSLEGPYGDHYDLSKYKKVLYIAGGTGIPGPFYHVENAVRRGKTNDQEIKLLWSTKSFQDLVWFSQELKILKASHVETSIYLSREKSIEDIVISNHNKPDSEDGEETRLLQSSSFINLFEELSSFINITINTRPNLEKIINKECQPYTGGSLNQSLAIVYCGPAIMCDQIRDTVANVLDQHDEVIDIYEELQVW